jgi:cytochrome c oxidase assembly protein subunit 15
MMSTPAATSAEAFAAADAGEGLARRHLALRIWLYAIAGLVFAMVLVGGATRLTDSGLSITEWKPLLGAIPPLSEADWQDAFQKYQQIPEYKVINRGMRLAEFKEIYWWEWAHRFLGRFIGLAFFLPFAVFWLIGAIPKGLMPRLIGIFVLGGLQGALGWFMVMSGLSERTDVSQYRLTAHLSVAVLIFAAVLWTAFDLKYWGERGAKTGWTKARIGATALIAAIFFQIMLGGLVAGTDAGLSHNTWPLMDGAIIPDGLGAMTPWWRNAFENVMTIQFNHRMMGYLVALIVFAQAAIAFRSAAGGLRPTAMLLIAAVLGQIALGVATLLTHMDIHVALTHQAGAIILFAIALRHLYLSRRAAAPLTA